MGSDAEDIGLTIHPHPTLTETVGFAAEIAEGTITDLMPPRKRERSKPDHARTAGRSRGGRSASGTARPSGRPLLPREGALSAGIVAAAVCWRG